MQAAYDAELDAKAEKPVSKILFDSPSGNNHIHLDHRLEDLHEADTQTAFEAMLETYLFCPAGLSGASNVNNTPPVYAIIHGRNLFETLALNMVSADELINIPYGEDEAAWVRNERIVPGAKTAEMSLLKALTWQPRRLTLQWDADGMVRRIYLQNGLNFQGNGLWKDPHVIFRKNKQGEWFSVKPELGRELWRDVGTLISGSRDIRSTIPIQNIQSIMLELPPVLDVELIGMITNNEAILGRTNERLRLPVQLFSREDLAQEFRMALNLAESMNRSLDYAVKQVFCHPQDKKKKSDIAQQACEAFLHEMQGVLFGPYLNALLEGGAFAERRQRYLNDMWAILDEAVLANIVEQTGSDVASLKRQNAVRGKVRWDYNKLKKEVEGN
ncbi:MAG: type I-E CRISPR-associated protein Cse1/CasA, partial [bacterium]